MVTLEETFDSKNLVGTYVCDETGDFVFKKGPLTVAAEQGLWLILRNIEDTPSDLLSFLLPLIQQNTLQVTSTFTIKPRLGFRIFALSKSDEVVIDDIKPLVSYLHQTHLESLTIREDFESILQKRFPALFKPIDGFTSIHALLQNSISFLQTSMNTLKSHLLDYKSPTVVNLFSLYQRVQAQFNTYEGSFLSQNQQ